jgi:formylglycine-generating enzyme required for sulfatase activity
MKNTIKQILETLKNTFGDSIFTDPKRFKAALADVRIESDGKKIRNLLNIAICDIRAYSRLEKAFANKNLFVVDNLVMEMSDDYTIKEDAAKIVIECIAELLGHAPEVESQPIIKPVQPVVKPTVKPAQPVIKPAQSVSQTANLTPKIISDPIVGDMVFVQGGTFKMGGTSEQGSDCYDDEKPVHDVTIGDFNIGKYTVTQRLWTEVMGDNPSCFQGNDSRPVERVSWNDVQQFITKLNQQTGKKYRLPTEAEWEYAARGGNMSRGYKYAGSNNIGDVAWYTYNSGSTTHPVGTKSPNELGIYDMSGNVWEWVSDWYGAYRANAETNPQGPSSGSSRVYRGGGWNSVALSCRVSLRISSYPDFRYSYMGFRLVLPSP